MRTAKLFTNGDGQVVVLPREFHFQGDEVLIKKSGNAVVLLPMEKSWDSLVDSLGQFSRDFMAEETDWQLGRPKKECRYSDPPHQIASATDKLGKVVQSLAEQGQQVIDALDELITRAHG
jgi:antitoxin VapB